MATKTVPAKRKASTTHSAMPATTDTKADGSQEPSIITIRQATCKNLHGTATLQYHIGRDDKGELHWKIHSNSGAGMFSKAWIPFDAIQKVLDKWPKDSPITSITLSPVCTGSINTRSFLLSTLVNEGILQKVPDKQRHYQLGDTAQFLAAMKDLTSSDSKPAKASGKVKAKAGARMSKGKAKPATGE